MRPFLLSVLFEKNDQEATVGSVAFDCKSNPVVVKIGGSIPSLLTIFSGALAQLDRASALQAEGYQFETDMFHHLYNKW